MTESRESPPIGPEDEDERSGMARPSTARRLAGLVESPATRRVALPRLAGASALAVGLVAVLALIAHEIAGTTARWLASQPVYRLPFSEIELDPPPGPWIQGGKDRILEQVRLEARHGEELSLLELDLKAFCEDFRRCPWVKEARVERHYRRLVVHLSYRKPVAVVVLRIQGEDTGFVIDEEAVPFPAEDINWTSKKSRFRVRGIDDPLIEILGVKSSVAPRFGVKWRRADSDDPVEGRDLRVLGAARLAEFLQREPKKTPMGRAGPDFASIWVLDESDDLFLSDPRNNDLAWGKAPGEEKPGESRAAEKWRLLLEWVDDRGQIEAKRPNYLRFTRSGIELVEVKRPAKGSDAPR